MYRSYVILDGNWLVLALPCLTYLAIIGEYLSVPACVRAYRDWPPYFIYPDCHQ
jgi:hypothetical protein